MDDNDLLLRHAERWASERKRTFDRELLETALDLRATHDGHAANRWPARSVEHLMLQRWPAHGPDCPDVGVLISTLDTFWRFLRSTGRMAGASAEPADLLREAKSAGRRMPAACADPSKHSASKSLLAYGREIGIDFDDVPTIDEANARMQRIVQAWNALPDAERLGRTPDAGFAGSRMGGALTDAAASMLASGQVPAGFSLPEPPRLDEDEDERYFPSDPADSAPHVRKSGFVRQALALADWVGAGREVTAAGVLRPAVAREAYRELGLWDWERGWYQAQGGTIPDDPDAEAQLAAERQSSWRSAGDCLALDRLWFPAVEAELIEVGRRTAVRVAVQPKDPMGWVQLGLRLVVGLLDRTGGDDYELLLTVLLQVSEQVGGPTTVEALRETWWRSEENELGLLADPELNSREASDRSLDAFLAMFDDCGLWVRRRGGVLVGTPLGWDAALVLMSILDGEGSLEDLGLLEGDESFDD